MPLLRPGALPHRQGSYRATRNTSRRVSEKFSSTSVTNTPASPARRDAPPATPRAHIDIALREADKNGCTDTPEALASGSPRLPRVWSGPGLLAYVITSKLGAIICRCTGWSRIFARQDVHIARSTITWCSGCWRPGKLVQPLVDLMANRVRASKVIHTDETLGFPCRTRPSRASASRVASGPTSATGIILILCTDYTPDRERVPGRASGSTSSKVICKLTPTEGTTASTPQA